MPIDLDKHEGPVAETDRDLQDVFEDLQGNILNGHGRDHAVHIFVRFDPAKAKEARAWIAAFAGNRITSARRQYETSVHFKQGKGDGGLFATLSLSATGYAALGIAAEKTPEDGPFKDGLKARRNVLLDCTPDEWDPGYQGGIDAIVLLAADNPADIIAVEREVLHAVKGFGETLALERGFNLRRRFEDIDKVFGEPVEHFGYADGVSQPVFLMEQHKREADNVGTALWNPDAPLDLVLVPDPAGTPKVSFGSYLVFRKLEQNVRAFRKAKRDLARQLSVSREMAGAMAVGRFEDGTPLVLQPGAGGRSFGKKPAVPNDFNYTGDPEGLACPFHAHIRKSNPRLESVNKDGPFAKTNEEELAHRIARRGIPYGGDLSLSEDLDELPEAGVGLLFMCYQSNIENQFEFMQRFWCNNPLFVKSDAIEDSANGNYDITGLDPIIGQAVPGLKDEVIQVAGRAPQNWPKGWGQRTVKPLFNFGNVIKLRGGEYFFTPSLTFLKGLSKS